VKDPVLIAMTVACARGVCVCSTLWLSRSSCALAELLINAAASLPPGTEIEQDRSDKGWRVRAARHAASELAMNEDEDREREAEERRIAAPLAAALFEGTRRLAPALRAPPGR